MRTTLVTFMGAIMGRKQSSRSPTHEASRENKCVDEAIPSRLEALPRDLLRQVWTILPLSDLATLSTTSRTLRRNISWSYDVPNLLNQQGNEIERARFLVNCFDELRPKHIICFGCGRYHRRKMLDKINKKGQRTIAESCNQHNDKIDPNLVFWSHLRNASWVKIHETARSLRYSDQHGSNSLNFISDETNLYKWWYDVSAILRDDRLLLCERWYRLVTDEILADPKKVSIQGQGEFCPHVNEHYKLHHLEDHMRQALRHIVGSKHIDPRGITWKRHRCPSCPTEIVIEIELASKFKHPHENAIAREHCVEGGYVLSYSRVIDFGKCKAPDELEWLSLTASVERTCLGNHRLPGWPGYVEPEGLWEIPRLDITSQESISVRFRRTTGMIIPVLMPDADGPIAPPPPYACRANAQMQQTCAATNGAKIDSRPTEIT
ncbi:hypothetical protein BKA63DRAFT_579401 [Paraphoma chrysanthemicola]|nr:hypothetical protein BKA63DRAFT_579401 [Paraphoma chrysanthemicola]